MNDGICNHRILSILTLHMYVSQIGCVGLGGQQLRCGRDDIPHGVSDEGVASLPTGWEHCQKVKEEGGLSFVC